MQLRVFKAEQSGFKSFEVADKGIYRLIIELSDQQIAEFVSHFFFLRFELNDPQHKNWFATFKQAVTKTKAAFARPS
jgi:hypothetical protein